LYTKSGAWKKFQPRISIFIYKKTNIQYNWMPDFIKGMSKGLDSSKNLLKNSVAKLSKMLKQTMMPVKYFDGKCEYLFFNFFFVG